MKNEKSKKIGKVQEKEIKVSDEGVVKGSEAKNKFKKFMELLKLQNPVKYERAEAELKKKLATL